jgi:hypothetical protein
MLVLAQLRDRRETASSLLLPLRRLLWAILCSLIATNAPALADGISGTYVGKNSNGAFLIQIVQTDDGHLTGHYEQVVLGQDGKLDDMNAAITGAANGQTVVLTITPTEFLAGSFVFSGTSQGRLLHLTGGGHGSNLTLNLLKADEQDFHTQVATLTDQARRLSEARALQEAARRKAKIEADKARIEADQLATIENLAKRMDVFISKVDAELMKLPPAEERYRTITTRMRAALARERSIHGGGQAGVARSQIAVAISQMAIETNQVHIGVQSAYQNFDFSYRQLLREFTGANQGCHAAPTSTSSEPAPSGTETLHSACLRLVDTAKKFQQRAAVLRAAFDKIENVWMTEGHDQEAIVQASSDASG